YGLTDHAKRCHAECRGVSGAARRARCVAWRTAIGHSRAGSGGGTAERLRAYRHELFGASSEARDADQLGLVNEAESLASGAAVQAREDEPSTRVAGHSRSKRGRKPLDAGLTREVVRHELPESERFCAHDGHALIEIGIETSEQLDVVPE